MRLRRILNAISLLVVPRPYKQVVSGPHRLSMRCSRRSDSIRIPQTSSPTQGDPSAADMPGQDCTTRTLPTLNHPPDFARRPRLRRMDRINSISASRIAIGFPSTYKDDEPSGSVAAITSSNIHSTTHDSGLLPVPDGFTGSPGFSPLTPREWLANRPIVDFSVFSNQHASNKQPELHRLPTFVLTCPTPVDPPSPIFVPRTPITVSKFVCASLDAPLIQPPYQSSTTPIPMLPQCQFCGLEEFESGSQCRECDQQWLACKIWYQANDGGRRQRLTEPYVKPAESNARTRALHNMFGVPGGSFPPIGLGIEAVQGGRQTVWQRLSYVCAQLSHLVSRIASNITLPHRRRFAIALGTLAPIRIGGGPLHACGVMHPLVIPA
ncbi:hypothetical protein K474DRAFT_862282 [Panus rudis PR-1116 ss-1]|nr:hypothetical protein K474DRAFT_862282 [Panus rudis PR-1116 ss-1]